MSDKKTLLEEGTIRRFMKLANMEAIELVSLMKCT